MTQQDDITQRVRDNATQILDAIRSAGYRDHPTNIERKRVDAILSAVEPLLSKLRAPVAVERAAFARAEISFPLTVPGNRVYLAGPMTGHENHNFPAFHAAAERLRASGLEVVNPADHGLVDGLGWADYMRWDLVKLAGCHSVYVLPGWEKSKGASLEVAIAHALGMPLFTVDGAPVLASAPVAGEAQAVAWRYWNEKSHSWNTTTSAAVADTMREAGRVVEPLYAAPQASAEDVRNAALEEAAKLMDQTLRSNGAALIRGLKRSQADKDSGQQRAGDDDLLRFAWNAIRAELDPQWECNSYHPMLYAAEERLRAALSATQEPSK